MGAKRLLVFLELEWDIQLGGKKLGGSTSFCLRQRGKMSPLKEGLCALGRWGGLGTTWDGLGRWSDEQSRGESNKSQVGPQGTGL